MPNNASIRVTVFNALGASSPSDVFVNKCAFCSDSSASLSKHNFTQQITLNEPMMSSQTDQSYTLIVTILSIVVVAIVIIIIMILLLK